MTTQTPEERLQVVDSLLKDTYQLMQVIKQKSRNPQQSGQLLAYSMVLDAFAEAGFDVRPDEDHEAQ